MSWGEAEGCPHVPMVKRSQYIMIKNPLHKQFEKACMCFLTRRVRTPDFTLISKLVFQAISNKTSRLVTVEFIMRVLFFGNDVLFKEKFYTALCQGNHSFCWSSEKARKHSVVALL